jgi:hypothetical protein
LERGLIFRLAAAWLFIFSSFADAALAEREWAPYLLPKEHPIKPVLDAIFSQSRAIFNLHALKKAGFEETKPRKFTSLLVTKHPLIPGYIFKLYLDAQRPHKNKPEHYFWMLRIQGAAKIREAIAMHSIGHLFKVPKKWIYELPQYPKPPKGYDAKCCILVEEDMEILSYEENKNAWKSTLVTEELLFYLHIILQQVGLSDCTKPDNIPFSYDGRIAFIDTQSFDEKVSFSRLSPFLSASNKAYWEMLIQK